MNARELVLDLPTKYRRAFERTSRRDLATAQIAGIVDAFCDQLDASSALADESRRATWMRAMQLVGQCAS